MTAGPALTRKAKLRWDRRRGAWMLLSPERGIALGESAAAILQRCDGSRSVDAIADELAREARTDPAVVRRDVVAFLEAMRLRGLVTGP